MAAKKNLTENIIDENMIIHGDIKFKGKTVLCGKVEGTISGDNLHVSETGILQGDATVTEMICHGRITGNIHSLSLSIGSKASVSGGICTGNLEIQSGANMDCTISKNKEQTKNIVPVTPPSSAKAGALVSLAFQNKDVVNIFFKEAAHNKILVDLHKDISIGKQIMSVYGEKGCGKTYICRALESRLVGTHKTIYLSNPVGSIKDILQRIARELKLDIAHEGKQADVLSSIKSSIAKNHHPVVLLLDEAEKMYPATLEGILKYLSKLYKVNTGHIQLVLFGDAGFKNQMETFCSHYQIEQEHHYELPPLTEEETKKYIEYRLEAADLSNNLGTLSNLPINTVKYIYAASNGIIGIINSLVVQAFQRASASNSSVVLPKHVPGDNNIRTFISTASHYMGFSTASR